jgi:tripartite-type tricarboxylate transporter receptor subunit TctC
MMRFSSFWRCAAIGALLLASAGGGALAQDFPSKPIRLVVPYTPGGGADRVARLLAQHLSPLLGQPVVVDNRGGASGAIGTDIVAKAAPDGHTWVMGTDPPFTINPHLRKMPFDPFKDFEPVVLVSKVPLVLVASPALRADNITELVKLAQATPDKVSFATSGSGSSAHLAAGLLMSTTNTRLFHVPYKGQAEAIADVVAGRSDLNFTAIESVLGLIKTGKLKAIAIGSDRRFSGLPGVPTVAEAGYPGFDVSAWHGLLVPARTPAPIVARINEAVNKVLQMPEVIARYEQGGLHPVGGPPDALRQLLKTDSERWAKVIREAGIKGE